MATKAKKSDEKKSDEIFRFTIEGELTIYRVSSIRESVSLALNTSNEVEIDLSHVTEIDGAGLQLLMAAKLESIANDANLTFVGHPNSVREMLDLCDLGGFFGDPVVMH